MLTAHSAPPHTSPEDQTIETCQKPHVQGFQKDWEPRGISSPHGLQSYLASTVPSQLPPILKDQQWAWGLTLLSLHKYHSSFPHLLPHFRVLAKCCLHTASQSAIVCHSLPPLLDWKLKEDRDHISSIYQGILTAWHS